MDESQLGTAFQADNNDGVFISEGILSFVEYAPRLLIVLPSRQFLAFETWDTYVKMYFRLKNSALATVM